MPSILQTLSNQWQPGLDALAERHRDAYAAAQPFPHIAIDDFLPAEAAEAAWAAFPKPGEDWQSFKAEEEKSKFQYSDVLRMPEAVRDTLLYLNSAPFLGFLEKITGVPWLVPDPYYIGGGMHQTTRGGRLNLHADFNKHLKMFLNRRLNLLIYLNKDWREEYGGHLELWDAEMKHCGARILPVFNRCVIFTISSDSWHGQPMPLECPEGESRKSLATYYYTSPVSYEELTVDYHSTVWQERPEIDAQGRAKAAVRVNRPVVQANGNGSPGLLRKIKRRLFR